MIQPTDFNIFEGTAGLDLGREDEIEKGLTD
jgi:hypothetical protein